MISERQKSYINMSLIAAEVSTYRFRLGAVIVAGGRVRGIGYSKYRNKPINVSESHIKGNCSVHAEMDALREYKNSNFFSGDKLKRGTIYVARLDKSGNPALAKPCSACTAELLENGILKMIWTVDANRFGTSKVEALR